MAKLSSARDCPIAQRTGILSSVRVGARELAGCRNDDHPLVVEQAKVTSSTNISHSKRSPTKGDQIRSNDEAQTPFERLAVTLEWLGV
ncbi:hypothetical protein HOY80DRAFT_947496 [Tuber brumale]|nr:hypothetical protein HOY80DRAFT_947496 [Tuber brumale]